MYKLQELRSIRSDQMKMNLSRTVAHKGQCNKKWFAANKKDRMQTKKIGCKQKTKPCHEVVGASCIVQCYRSGPKLMYNATAEP